MIEELEKELPDYLSAAEGACSAIDAIAWNAVYLIRLKLVNTGLPIQPTSAVAERLYHTLIWVSPGKILRGLYQA